MAGFLALLSTAAAAGEPTRWALLIGVDEYAVLKDLEFAGADQRALGVQLIQTGFPKDQVILFEENAKEHKYRPSRANILRELRLFSAYQSPAMEGKIDGPFMLARIDRRLPVGSQPPSDVKPTKVITNSIGMKLRLISPGEFLMGSDGETGVSKAGKDNRKLSVIDIVRSGGAAQDETQHRVRISRPFYLGTYEVTQS